MVRIYPGDLPEGWQNDNNLLVYNTIGTRIPEIAEKPDPKTIPKDILEAYLDIIEDSARIIIQPGKKEETYKKLQEQINNLKRISKAKDDDLEDGFSKFKNTIEDILKSAFEKISYIQ